MIKSIRFGDPRLLAETTVAKDAVIMGRKISKGDIIRISSYTNISGKQVMVPLPSMAELMYSQADNSLQKASKIKNKAIKTSIVNGNIHLDDEQSFYLYLQLTSSGILGLYSALESMVFELYIRKYKENPVVIDGKELTHSEFTNKGFTSKITRIATQLSGKSNIYGTELMDYANEIHKLRSIIQHWDIERRDDYFLNLPDNHPVKRFIDLDPASLSQNTRTILDHYSLKADIIPKNQ